MRPVAGIGLRSPHLAEIAHDRPATGFLEIHAENYLAGSPALQAVECGCAGTTISPSTPWACRSARSTVWTKRICDRVAALIDRLAAGTRFRPSRLEYARAAAISTICCRCPIPRKRSRSWCAMSTGCRSDCGRQVLVENPSCYLAFAHSTSFGAGVPVGTGPAQRLRAAAGRANNIVVTAHNLRLDPAAWLDGLPAHRPSANITWPAMP